MKRRKFISDLVGFGDRLLVALWPAPASTSHTDVLSVNRHLFPLHAYIEHILRRSRVTYTTLLAAFYYLTLLQTSISQQACNTDNPDHQKSARPLLCQRRMFLAALMLASKFTQDRNYSSRAWATISGLCSKEINTNEAVFLSTIDWHLYISLETFERWTVEVLFYARLPDLALPKSLLTCLEKDIQPGHLDHHLLSKVETMPFETVLLQDRQLQVSLLIHQNTDSPEE